MVSNKVLNIFFLILSLQVLSCCAKEDAAAIPGESCPVEFTAFSENQAEGTRGTVVNPSDITGTGGTGIGIFAFYQKAKSNGYPSYFNSNTGSPNFMDNQHLTYDSSLACWTYNPVKYWPNSTGDMLSFFASAPYKESTAWEDLGIKANLSGTRLTCHYAVQEDVRDQQDYLWADPLLNLTKPGVSSRLKFSFTHLCVKVGATCKVNTYSDDDNYTITRVAISGKFCSEANLVYDIQNGTRTWTDKENGTSITYTLFNGSQKVDNTSESAVGTSEYGYAFLLPVTCDVTLTVDYIHHTTASDVSGTMTDTYSSTALTEGASKNFLISFNI